MLQVEGLTRFYGPLQAVKSMSFEVRQGEVLGFLGPNGAGKSTTMKMITGFLTPSAGSVKVSGHDVEASPIAAKQAIGYLAEGAPAYPDMTPVEFLIFVARVRGYSGNELMQKVDAAIDRANLRSVAHKNIDTLSKGFKRRVGIAQAILHDPPVLIMDEPTDGLDPNQKHEMRLLISEMAKNKAIIVSTHILEEVNALCTRAIIIAQGKLLFDGTPADLEQRSAYHNAVTLTVSGGASTDTIADALRKVTNVARVEVSAGADGRMHVVAFPESGASVIGDISQLVRAQKWELDEISVETGRLDEVFRAITSGTSESGREVLT
ncbi:MAG TPA: ABC transporter ATP-binding protein [Gammaproteobacteria bacterium]|nr:ABC transporter ATP-binding protein [Gammaproteobacteria bacterium]